MVLKKMSCFFPIADQEACVTLYPDNQGYWNDDNCGLDLGYVCKKPSGNTVPPPPTTQPPSGHCPNGWYHAGK